MKPGALKVHLRDLKTGGLLIVNTQAFDKRNLDKAGYAANRSTSRAGGALPADKVDMTGLTTRPSRICRSTEGEGPDQELLRARPGLVDLHAAAGADARLDREAVREEQGHRRGQHARPEGRHAFGETAEIFAEHYAVEPAEMAPGLYRAMTGNRALAWGILAAAQRSKVRSSTAPIRSLRRATSARARDAQALPRADHSRRRRDRAVTAAIGPRSAGRSASPRRAAPAWRSERRHRPRRDGGVAARRPEHPARRAVDGHATKTEQADLMQALYGRNSEAPVIVLAPATPGDCFYIAYEAVRLAAKYMVP